MADSKRKLNNLITKLQSRIDYESESYASTGRSVKDITNYFEHISKGHQPDDLKSFNYNKADAWSPNRGFEKFNLSRSRIPSLEKPTLSIRKSSPKNANLHSVWTNAMLQGQSMYCRNAVRSANANVFSNVRDSLRTSLVTCVLLLQYIM